MVYPGALQARNAGPAGGFCHGFGHGWADPGIKRPGDNIVRRELLRRNQRRQCPGGGHFHLLVDIAGPDVKRTPEHAGEGQNIIDLVRIIAAPGGDDLCAPSLGLIREYLRRRVRVS